MRSKIEERLGGLYLPESTNHKLIIEAAQLVLDIQREILNAMVSRLVKMSVVNKVNLILTGAPIFWSYSISIYLSKSDNNGLMKR